MNKRKRRRGEERMEGKRKEQETRKSKIKYRPQKLSIKHIMKKLKTKTR